MTMPLPLAHSWPLFAQSERFRLGRVLDVGNETHNSADLSADALAKHGGGVWACDLKGDVLTWSAGVFDLFSLPRGVAVERGEIAARYAEPSRSAMERLRAYAIKHRRGFTLDAQIAPFKGPRKWMRLIVAPVCIGREVVRLHGLKLDVSAAYK